MSRKIRTAVLISGRGSNMEALATAAQATDYPAEISLVISNRPNAAGLAKAQTFGIETVALDHTDFASRADFDTALHEVLTAHDIELICCAGFMRILTPEFTQKWERRALNIHPSLLPKYKGLNTHSRALDAGDDRHGCTVHWVSSELDGGEIILQDEISIGPNDTPESLAERLLPLELNLYPRALQQVARERLRP